MNRILLAIAFAALLSVPLPAQAAERTDRFPDELVALTLAWIEEAQNDADGYADRPWHAEADRFLQSARAEADAGRFRAALFDLETHHELVLGSALYDEVTDFSSHGQRKAYVAERTRGWAEEAHLGWQTFRARLHEYDGQLRSLHSVERSLYAGDLALGYALTLAEYQRVEQEFQAAATVDRDHVLQLVTLSATPARGMGWALEVAETAGLLEGLPPELMKRPWDATKRVALVPVDEDQLPPQFAPHNALFKPVRENREGLLAVTFALSEMRMQRVMEMGMIFGDGASRDDAPSKAVEGMNRQLANASMQPARDIGLQGLFTLDAIDRAERTRALAETNPGLTSYVFLAWASLDHAGFVVEALKPSSPIRPAAIEEDARTPVPLAVALAAVLVAAVALRRR